MYELILRTTQALQSDKSAVRADLSYEAVLMPLHSGTLSVQINFYTPEALKPESKCVCVCACVCVLPLLTSCSTYRSAYISFWLS